MEKKIRRSLTVEGEIYIESRVQLSNGVYWDAFFIPISSITGLTSGKLEEGGISIMGVGIALTDGEYI